MNEEKYIEEKFGKRNPFRVPDGYFEGLADEVMRGLPDNTVEVRKPRAKTVWMRPVFYAAASVCALFVCAAIWLSWPQESSPSQGQMAKAVEVKQVQQQETDDAFFDEAADYMMLDNQDIYACLASEY